MEVLVDSSGGQGHTRNRPSGDGQGDGLIGYSFGGLFQDHPRHGCL